MLVQNEEEKSMNKFKPDYRNIVKAARNVKPERIPLYEHIISPEIMEEVLDNNFKELYHGDKRDKLQYFKNICKFYQKMGYDTVSFERVITSVMPESGALEGGVEGVIKNREDFENYPWEDIVTLFFENFSEDYQLLKKVMPKGMKAIGGAGNGVFECVQDVVGYEQLCLISVDDPDLYRDLFSKTGEIILSVWEELLKRYSDMFAVCRMGDDLGFKSSTLISVDDIKQYLIPQYTRIIEEIHSYDIPFLFHCCGNIFPVMNDLIEKAGIDAKHSNEDQIAPFVEWIDRYGEKIGNFGGVDTDHLCRKSETEIKKEVIEIFNYAKNDKGVAFSSGNSIPDYVPVEGYLAMVETVRECRNE